MNEYSIHLSGVSCGGCVNKIRRSALEQDANFSIEVSEDKTLANVISAFPVANMIQIVESLGYQAKEVAPERLSLPVQKVKCGGCVNKIRKALTELDPNAQIDADIEGQQIQVESNLSLAQIEAELDKLGYLPTQELEEIKEAAPRAELPSTEKAVAESPLVRLNLQGVTCASCVNTIEKALNGVEGVDSVMINFANRTAQVHANVNADTLIMAIENSGYGATEILDEEKAEAEREAAEQAEYKHKMRQTYLGLGLGVPLMLYGMLGGSMTVSTTSEQLVWGVIGLLTFAVLATCGKHYFKGASKAFVNRNANMDTLVALGTGSAWLYSMAIVMMPTLFPESARHLYFEASAMIIGLINLGQALELKARGRTSQAIRRLLDLRAKTALVIRDGKTTKLPIEEVVSGDKIVIRAGEKVPVDGEIIEGSALIDESMLTGEPVPVSKELGDSVSAGTVNGNSSLTIVATKVGSDTVLAQIINMVTQAQNSKPAIAHLADKVSSIFVPSVMIIAVLTALGWYNFGADPVWIHMLVTATSVLIIACPCALGLATPISTMIGVGKAAEFGGLIRNGDALQRASDIDVVVLDKTGTITQGKPSVVEAELFDQEALSVLKALEQGSTHPLAEAVVNYCEAQGVGSELIIEGFESLTGLGVKGSYKQENYFLGNARLMKLEGVSLESVEDSANRWESEANTVVYFAKQNQLLGMLAIKDPIKAESAGAIKAMHELGIKVVMLTGDNAATAKAVAKATNIDEFHAELLPQDKLAWVERLQNQGKVVAMVGDGINDAPALARSDVGFAIGQGTDVAIESADITLMRGSLYGVSQVIETSKATMKNIKQNLWGAFIYNSLGIPIAAGVLFPLTGWLLSPIVAGVAMSLSSITVVSNANRLRLFKPKSSEV